MGPPDFRSYSIDPASGLDAESAVDGFRYNLLGLSPIYAKDIGKTFYKSNIFYAPFDPYRPIYIHTSWQANDPLVHYLVDDFLDLNLQASNQVDFASQVPPLQNLGRLNSRYQPWGGNPVQLHPATDYQVAVKDPMVTRADDWDFPTNQSLGIGWIGRVHRGTPWQTTFLKSTNILDWATTNAGLATWQLWTGDDAVRSDPAQPDRLVPDAQFTAPTNDWHLVSLLNNLLNQTDPRQLASANQASVQSWEMLLDGMTVLTNSSPGGPTALVMSSNSPQAELIAQSLLEARSSQPGNAFQGVGDLLAVPELTMNSPWLGPVNNFTPVTDQALEIIPSQLLPLLRQDSIGSAKPGPGQFRAQFSGIDGYSYTTEASSNLVDWISVSTNRPDHGAFELVIPAGRPAQFYRSKLIP